MRETNVLCALMVGLLSAVPAVADEARFGAEPVSGSQSNRPEAGAPPGTLSLDIDGSEESVWPVTGDDFGSLPKDPINLVFVGEADPRSIRAALMSVTGDRTAFNLPNAAPFNCTWADAIGYHQTSYASGAWAASSIQLECGDYTVLRTHLRLFRHGRYTLGGAHFEIMAPGTADHFPFSWEFAEFLVRLDLMRSGLLAASPTLTPVINGRPAHGTVDHRIVNALPLSLRALVGLPTTPQSAPVPIPNDGQASVLSLVATPPVTEFAAERSLVRVYNTIAPKPFCATGPLDLIRIQGPLDFSHRVTVSPEGDYHAETEVTGTLSVTPVDPTGLATGPSVDARIAERQLATISDGQAWAENVSRRTLLGDTTQALFQKLRVGTQERFELDVDCGQP